MPWTHFWDMHSGGDQKLDWAHIYIEAPRKQAEIVFYKRFGRNPNQVTCSCCGPDYSISEENTLKELTGFHRGCYYNENTHTYEEKPSERLFIAKEYLTLKKYLEKENIKVIYSKDIDPKEMLGDLPKEGWIWIDPD